MGRRKMPKVKRPDICFSCRSFSPTSGGMRSTGYCMKWKCGKNPKDWCGSYRAEVKTTVEHFV